jgi:hypothetical protein
MNPPEDWVFGDTGTLAGRNAPVRVAPPGGRKRRAFGRLVLFVVWLLCFTVGIACVLLMASGFLRDGSFGDARVPVDLSHESRWHSAQFRPWVPGTYRLYLTSDDPEDRAQEFSFEGSIDVRVATRDGGVKLEESYRPPALDHRLRGGIEWTRLGVLHLSTPALEPWTISVRVATPDPAFAYADSSVLLKRDKRTPGLSGLINYAAAIPAGVFLALSVPAALGLPRRGGTWMPALLSVFGLLAVAALIVWV